jgi:hypothetical protein
MEVDWHRTHHRQFHWRRQNDQIEPHLNLGTSDLCVAAIETEKQMHDFIYVHTHKEREREREIEIFRPGKHLQNSFATSLTAV